jgi:hypothetical protein
MKKPLNQALRNILECTIDEAISRKQRLRTEAEDRLYTLQNGHQIDTADLVALFRGVLDIQRAQDSISADRYSLLNY